MEARLDGALRNLEDAGDARDGLSAVVGVHDDGAVFLAQPGEHIRNLPRVEHAVDVVGAETLRHLDVSALMP
jgi:hypothetical protein